MPRFLFSGEYHYILYRIADTHQVSVVADGLKYLAHTLESGVLPTNSQRTRLVFELLAILSRPAWSEYETRQWYYIATSQMADARLASSLLGRAKLETNVHLQVWGLLAASMSAGEARVLDSFRARHDKNIRVRNEALLLGRERCGVFSTMLEVLTAGQARFDPSVINIGNAPNNDIELLLLAYGRGQLRLADSRAESSFQRFITNEGIYHESALVSEYSYWCSRVRSLQGASVNWASIDRHPHNNVQRVRSAIYRLLGSRGRETREQNWDYLSEQARMETDSCRFRIFSALSTRIGTYDTLLKTSERRHLDAFIDWHLAETDQRCMNRQFAFLVNNLDDSEVQNYLIEEIGASDQARAERYIPIIRHNRNLPARFASEMKRIGVLSTGTQLDFAESREDTEQRRALLRSLDLPSKIQLSASALSLEDELERGFRLSTLETVVIATANTREAQTVLAQLRAHSEALGFQVTTNPSNSLPFHEGRLPGKSGPRRAIVVRADDTGPLDAIDLVRRIIDSFQPNYIFFVGCAAFLDEKQPLKPNSVFVARRAIDVDKRMEDGGGTLYDMEQAPGDLRVLRNIDALLDAGRFDPIRVITNRYFLSGSAFMKNRNSDARKDYVSRFSPDAVVLEMEAFAVLKAVQLRRAEGLSLSVAVIKGISDVGDENAQIGKDAAQRAATENAMRVACTLLAFL